MGKPGLLPPKQLDDLLRRRALAERLPELARRFSLTLHQVYKLLDNHRRRLESVCAEFGIPPPRHGGYPSLHPAKRRRRRFLPRPPTDAAPPARTRTCLKCGDDFTSEGPWNRVCAKCKISQAWRLGGDWAVHTGSRMGAPGAD